MQGCRFLLSDPLLPHVRNEQGGVTRSAPASRAHVALSALDKFNGSMASTRTSLIGMDAFSRHRQFMSMYKQAERKPATPVRNLVISPCCFEKLGASRLCFRLYGLRSLRQTLTCYKRSIGFCGTTQTTLLHWLSALLRG